MAGIISSGHVPPALQHPFLLIPAAAVILLTGRLRLPLLTLLLLALSFFLLGSVIDSHDHREVPLVENHIKRLVTQRQEVVLTGILDRMVSGNGQLDRVVIELLYLRKKDVDHFIRAQGKVLLTLSGNWPEAILPGDAVTVRTSLKHPGTINTPGVFDYREHLAAEDIYVVGTISSPLLIHKTATEHHSPSVRHRIEKIRTTISAHLKSLDNRFVSGLYRAMLLGDRTSVPEDVITAFKRSGTFHILAVSGLHMSLLSFFLFFTFYTLFKHSETLILSINIKKLSLLCCIPVLLLYTFLAGANPPVVRSFIMAFLAVCALCSDRITSPLTIVSCAAFIMLAFEPSAVFSASFQLSFAAVIAIIIMTPKMLCLSGHEISQTRGLPCMARIVSWIMILVCVSLSATIGTAPILLYHFNQISTVSVPANLLIEPLICFWGLPCGFLALPFIFFSPTAADFLFQAGAIGIKLAVKIATLLATAEFSTVWLPNPSPIFIVVYYVSLVIILYTRVTALKITGGICLCIAVFSLIFSPAVLPVLPRNNSRVTFIDIGQGSSSLVEFKRGGTFLIDGGAVSAPGFNSGERIIAPFLWHRGIGRLDDIVLTHADSDHYNGLEILLRRFQPKRLWLPPTGSDSDAYLSMLNTARHLGISIRYPEDESIVPDQFSRIRIIDVNKATDERTSITAGHAKNDRGLMVKIDLDGTGFLFPGDISAKKEKVLVDSGIELTADVMLSPHHGSSTSNSSLFLSKVGADYMIVSSSDYAALRFPSEKTMENARTAGATVLRTVKDGTIAVTTGEQGYQVSCYREKRWRTCTPEI